jgi:hypothetical protein
VRRRGFRVGHDVIAHQPDLVFVEFAVNDGGHDLVVFDAGNEEFAIYINFDFVFRFHVISLVW